MNRKHLVIIFFCGVLFGAGLALSGMTNPERVIGFLDLTQQWDPTLAFVMAGALLVFSTGLIVLRKNADRWKITLPSFESGPVTIRLVAGAALFGIGWGLGGFCPGPAIANLGPLRFEALLFLPAMIAGMLISQQAFGADR